MDGIPERLAPVAATGERPSFMRAEPPTASARRRIAPVVPDDEGPAEREAEEEHIVNDLA